MEEKAPNYIEFSNGSKISFKGIDETIKGNSPIPNQFDFFHEATKFDSDKFERINAVWNKDNPKYKPVKIRINQDLVDKHLKELEDINTDFISEFEQHVSNTIIKQKEELILSKIKNYLPEFSIENELKRENKRLYLDRQGNETHYFLKHNNKNIRLITFVTKDKPIENFKDKIQISVEEYYY